MSYFGSTDYYLQTARGLVTGVSSTASVAEDNKVGTAFKDIWFHNSDLIYPTSGETWEVVSTNTQDSAGGTGIRSLAITSLDTNYNEQTTLVSLNGTTPVTITGTHFRCNSSVAATVGTLGGTNAAAGQITIRDQSSGNPRDIIKQGNIGSFGHHYTVPLGKTAFFVQFTLHVPKDQDVSIRTTFQLNGVGPFINPGDSGQLYQNSLIVPFKAPLILPEKSEFYHRASSTNDNVNVSATSEFIIVDNS